MILETYEAADKKCSHFIDTGTFESTDYEGGRMKFQTDFFIDNGENVPPPKKKKKEHPNTDHYLPEISECLDNNQMVRSPKSSRQSSSHAQRPETQSPNSSLHSNIPSSSHAHRFETQSPNSSLHSITVSRQCEQSTPIGPQSSQIKLSDSSADSKQ